MRMNRPRSRNRTLPTLPPPPHSHHPLYTATTTNTPVSREARNSVTQKAQGSRGRRRKIFRFAKDAPMKGQYWPYCDRKARKRNFRNLWVVRINAAVRGFDMSYSRFIEAM